MLKHAGERLVLEALPILTLRVDVHKSEFFCSFALLMLYHQKERSLSDIGAGTIHTIYRTYLQEDSFAATPKNSSFSMQDAFHCR